MCDLLARMLMVLSFEDYLRNKPKANWVSALVAPFRPQTDFGMVDFTRFLCNRAANRFVTSPLYTCNIWIPNYWNGTQYYPDWMGCFFGCGRKRLGSRQKSSGSWIRRYFWPLQFAQELKKKFYALDKIALGNSLITLHRVVRERIHRGQCWCCILWTELSRIVWVSKASKETSSGVVGERILYWSDVSAFRIWNCSIEKC